MGESFNAWMGIKKNTAMFANGMKNIVLNYDIYHRNMNMIEMHYVSQM